MMMMMIITRATTLLLRITKMITMMWLILVREHRISRYLSVCWGCRRVRLLLQKLVLLWMLLLWMLLLLLH